MVETIGLSFIRAEVLRVLLRDCQKFLEVIRRYLACSDYCKGTRKSSFPLQNICIMKSRRSWKLLELSFDYKISRGNTVGRISRGLSIQINSRLKFRIKLRESQDLKCKKTFRHR